MPKSEKQKLKIFYIAKYFYERTDENTPATIADIEDYLLTEWGIEAERRSIGRDIALLRNAYGMDIDYVKGGKYYRLLSREFEFDDLRLLAECVHATKFISASKAKELVESIGKFASIYEAEKLQEEVFLCDRVKTTRTDLLRVIDLINHAMAKKEYGKRRTPTKIRFQYMHYEIGNVHTQVERRKGAKYIVSPYKLLINDGNYYLLAYSDEAEDMRTFRVDRMKKVEVLEETPRDGEEVFSKIDMTTYTQRVFGMYSGKEVRVRMRFTNSLLDTVIERFGTGHDVYYLGDDAHHFTVSANVQVSDQFFAWLCGFRKRASIVAPNEIVEDMKAFIKDISSRYE
ncbi:MAG: WYL domain-containing protein [Lachnospiraceae bacterium]|nr:WYL domain-containing protein [Lachnospiraceae bacterium]